MKIIYFDSFRFPLMFHYMACCHCIALTEFLCLNCRFLSMHPNYPKLSILLQLKCAQICESSEYLSFNRHVVLSLCTLITWSKNYMFDNSLSQFPVSDELPVHGWPPV